MPTSAASAGVRAASATPLRQVERTSPDETFVLAVDLGTGGPKVALLVGTGRIAAHAFAPVGVTLTDDGGAEQSPQAWWEAIVSSARRALADSGVAPDRVVGVGCTAQWSGTVAVDGAGDAIGPAIIWMDSRGAQAVRKTVRGALNVQGYSASKAARWVRKTGGIPSLSGKDPVGHIHFLRTRRPDVYASTAVFLEPVDYLNLRLTGLARASHDSITLHWVTDNRDRRRSRTTTRLLELAGLERATLPDLVPTGSVLGGLTAGAAERARLAGGDSGRGRHRGPAFCGRRFGRRGGLRRPPLHRHLELDQLPRPLQEDRRADQHRVHSLGPPRPSTCWPTSTRRAGRA